MSATITLRPRSLAARAVLLTVVGAAAVGATVAVVTEGDDTTANPSPVTATEPVLDERHDPLVIRYGATAPAVDESEDPLVIRFGQP